MKHFSTGNHPCFLRAVLLSIVLLMQVICADPAPRPRLNSAQATRLADLKVQSLGRDLRQYHRSQAKYDAADDGWWINYRHKGGKHADLGFREFNILVEDKTKQTLLVLP